LLDRLAEPSVLGAAAEPSARPAERHLCHAGASPESARRGCSLNITTADLLPEESEYAGAALTGWVSHTASRSIARAVRVCAARSGGGACFMASGCAGMGAESTLGSSCRLRTTS